jgi:hypothetical protein
MQRNQSRIAGIKQIIHETFNEKNTEVTGNNQVGCVPSPGFTTSYNISNITATQATLMVDGFTASAELMKIVNLKR